ncbi:hypothetical protein W97_05334 [Coniosporium apollinis CBS 100218]|uniref:NAD(P)-binding domain-containing protein n=1 Tax=Coniosporium apollinis (strain CBS 100218) TaxID=1168221 RepID=R7YWS9_CONA1|nr:uncharacterized protein W97_05334 [Coniosporium apollinis CBS 100218]EON66091.1 hypothetical protein W97_05334 [Coniosporium apollinis CBS 100218]
MSKRTIAYFGATGGSVAASLALALQNGHLCSVLVRTEAKLRALVRERGISDERIASHLTIVTGSVKDPAAVAQTLQAPSKGAGTVDVVISGIGGKPRFTPDPLRPTLEDPTICQDATRMIFDTLRSLGGPKPHFVVISTIGVNQIGRGIPIAMTPLYHWLLTIPHQDVREMETMVMAEMEKPALQRAIRSYLVVRPSLLTDGEMTSMDRIRVASDINPQFGYTISRNDVGMWLFETAVRGTSAHTGGRIVTITG